MTRPSETDKRFRDASTECEADLPRDLRAMAASSQPECDIATLEEAAEEIERLERVLARMNEASARVIARSDLYAKLLGEWLDTGLRQSGYPLGHKHYSDGGLISETAKALGKLPE